MNEKEIRNIYAIPANYTDSGKLFGGMLETRNTVEAVFLVLLVGYPELMWMQVPWMIKIVIMTVTILPLGILALMGIGGDTLFEYIMYMGLHFFRRRKLHYRRIGIRYATNNKKEEAFEKKGVKKGRAPKAGKQQKG